MSEKDDEATVVVNIKDLKKHFEDVDDTKEIDDLEFLVDSNISKEIENTKLAIFDYKSKALREMVTKGIIPEYAKLLTSTKELNEFLKNKESKCILFNYHVEPKAINMLLAQINKISPRTKTIIIAKGLNQDFISKHQISASKASNYLNFPFKLETLTEILKM